MCFPAGIPAIKRVRMAIRGAITKENLEVCFPIFGAEFNYSVSSVNKIKKVNVMFWGVFFWGGELGGYFLFIIFP